MSDNIKNIALCHACGNYIDSETHQKLCMETIQFQCQVCEKGFKKLRYLKEHVKIHINDSLYQCDKCPKKLRSMKILRMHVANVHNVTDSTHVCAICSAEYKRIYDLKRHLKIHSEKKYICQFCSKSFHLKQYKTSHEKHCH